jgi:aryl-alcohol dehydrogenase-like predicted oxidoreductase
MTDTPRPAHASGQYLIGGDLAVYRLGYGSMQLTGPGHWYHPVDADAAKRLLRRVVELGVNHLDTADAYGPDTVEHLIRKALHPYPPGLVIATKGGLTRPGPNRWEPVGRPAYLQQCIEMSLRRLALDQIDLYYLHRIDPLVPLADQLGVLVEAQQAGKIRHIGLSKVTVAQIEEAVRIVPIAAVQNRYNLTEGDDDVLAYCEDHGIAFVPYKPLAAGALAARERADDATVTPAQAAIGYLLDKSPNMLPIPGTSDPAHLQDNVRAAVLRLDRRSNPSAATPAGDTPAATAAPTSR